MVENRVAPSIYSLRHICKKTFRKNNVKKRKKRNKTF